MISGYRQELVSRLTTASVDRHCGAKMYQASRLQPVARVQVLAIRGSSCADRSSPDADMAYTVPSAPTATSRAARPGTSAMEICQLKPMGANTFSSIAPSCPAKLYWIAGPVAPSGGTG